MKRLSHLPYQFGSITTIADLSLKEDDIQLEQDNVQNMAETQQISWQSWASMGSVDKTNSFDKLIFSFGKLKN